MDVQTLGRSSGYETIALRTGTSAAGFNAATASGNASGMTGAQAVREFVGGTFFSILLAEMQKSVPRNELCGSHAEDMFREMLNREYASTLADSTSFPLVEAAVRQLGLENGEGQTDAETQ